MGPPCAGPAESVYGIETGSPKAGPRQTGKEREVGGYVSRDLQDMISLK